VRLESPKILINVLKEAESIIRSAARCQRWRFTVGVRLRSSVHHRHHHHHDDGTSRVVLGMWWRSSCGITCVN